MYRLNNRIERRGQKSIDLARSRHRLGLRATVTIERRPDASEGEQRPIVVERKPHQILVLLGWRV